MVFRPTLLEENIAIIKQWARTPLSSERLFVKDTAKNFNDFQ
jgi:hypothetical protein